MSDEPQLITAAEADERIQETALKLLELLEGRDAMTSSIALAGVLVGIGEHSANGTFGMPLSQFAFMKDQVMTILEAYSEL